MRIITGGIMHETHTFSAEPTPFAHFDVARGEELWRFAGTNHSMGGVVDESRARGIELVPTFFAQAVSTAAPDRATFAAMVDELVAGIRSALPADGVVLTLHGAMVAEGCFDADGEIVRRVREAVGPDMPIAVTLDLHANIGQEMVDDATIVVGYDTYPHVDIAERAREAVALLAETIAGRIKPVMALVKPPLMPVPQAMFTGQHPFKTIFDRAFAIERAGAALSISVAGGFAYADCPMAGMSILAITDDDREGADRIAHELAELAWSLRGEMLATNAPVDQAVAEAIAYPEGPVVLVDVGDNIGGGTPGDGTVILRELLKQGAREATIVIADAEAVRAALAAGIGQTVTVTVGAKADRLHGDPTPVTGYVRALTDGRFILDGPENAGTLGDMGPTAVLRVDGVNLVLTTKKFAPGDLQQLKSVGIDPARQQILVVKAAVRWRGGYGPITKHAILVDTPGLGATDLSRFPFQHVTRPIYPLDLDTEWTPADARRSRRHDVGRDA